MKKLILVAVMTAGFMTGAYAQATVEHDDAMTYNVKGILLKLQEAGYQNVSDIELKKGMYMVKALNSKGNLVKFKIPSNSGNLSEAIHASKEQGLSMLEAVEKLEKAGYSRITKIEAEGKCYEANAINPQGKSMNLCVDRWSGKIKKDYLEIF